MYVRAQRKLQGEVSLSDSLDADGEGGSLSILATLAVEDDMLENLDTRDACQKVRGAWPAVWTSGKPRSSPCATG